MRGQSGKREGVDWVEYVPTQLRKRREERHAKFQKVREDARQAALASWNGAHAGLKRAAYEAHGAIRFAGPRAERALIRLSLFTSPVWRGLASAIAWLAVWARAIEFGRLAGFVGVLLLLAASLRYVTSGADGEATRFAYLGTIALAVSLAPPLWRLTAPRAAAWALGLLRTRRVSDGSAGRSVGFGQAVRGAVAVGAVAAVSAGALWGYGKLVPPEPPLAGRANVVSADTIRIGRTAVRLTGIAAPEAAQRCGQGRQRWSCGSAARRALSSLADGKKVSCIVDSRQSEQAATGRCSVGGKDIGSRLVRDGHVWVDRYDSAGYRKVESEAREEKAGIWRSPSAPPWEWRDQLWAEAKKEAPDGCPIKAERTRRAQVYHMPWEPGYERLRITKSAERRGTRRWFCSEKEAIQAGFKPADASG